MKNLVAFENYFNTNKVDFFAMIGINKEWEKVILDAINNIPEDAKPTVVTNFTRFKSVTGRKDIFNKNTTNNYGVTIQSTSIELPKEYMTDEIKDAIKEKGYYNDRVMEISKTFKIYDFLLYNSIQVVGFNCNTYKTLDEVSTRKEMVDKIYLEQKGAEYFFNKTGRLTIYHEFGHVYNNRMHISDSSDWKFATTKWYNECRKDIIKNPSEAYSEAFADYYGNNGARLPEYIKVFFKK